MGMVNNYCLHMCIVHYLVVLSMFAMSSLLFAYMHLNSLIHCFILHIAQVLEQVTPKFDLALCPTAVQNEAKNRSMDYVPSKSSYCYIIYIYIYTALSPRPTPPPKHFKNWEQPGDKPNDIIFVTYNIIYSTN